MGGGINGCTLARAAAQRGIRTALVEKNDFGCGVTSRSTRLIHGGLRYLESFQFGVVRESLRDRETLLTDHPGLVTPTPFVLPVYRSDSRRPWYLALGLGLYRLLAAGSALPRHRRLDPAETLSLLPGLDPRGLLGGFEYYDCQAVYPERLALEAALQSEALGASAWNHAKVTGFLVSNSVVGGVMLDSPGRPRILRSRLVVNAAGPWVDSVLGLLPSPPAGKLLRLVNGAHIVVRDFGGAPRHAVYHEARADRRPFFIVPWRRLHLIGTTETAFDGDPDRVTPSSDEILYLVRETNELFPEAGLSPESVLYAYCGSRPLMWDDGGNLNRASRGHAVVDHEREHGIRGLLTMAGGKLTTAPSFAEETVRAVERKLGRPAWQTRRDGLPPEGEKASSRLAGTYGRRAAEVARFLRSSPERAEPLAQGCCATVGEVLYAVRHEKARTLGDVLLRRTGLAFDPEFEFSWAERTAEVVAPLLGWSSTGTESALADFEDELAVTLPRPSGMAVRPMIV